MSNITGGLIAGFIATVVLSVMLVLKNMMGIMLGLDPIIMMATMMGMPAIVGWVGHFMIGTVAWGGGFAILNDVVPGSSQLSKGIVWGIGAWLAMMIMVMPMAGAGFFGMSMGIMAPMMTLIMHLVFGAVLGKTFERYATEGPVAA